MNMRIYLSFFFFFFNDTATTEIYTLSLHDALPIYLHYKPLPRTPASPRSPEKCRLSSWPVRFSKIRALCAFSFLRADRKSTRLNSSHSQISYAVFCLKKKKKQTPPPSDDTNLPLRP